MKTPVLVLLSFTATLNAIANGTFSVENLDRAIFCFGCGSMWPMKEPELVLEVQKQRQTSQIDEGMIVAVKEALTRAQQKKQVIWRSEVRLEVAIEQIDAALISFGLNPLNLNLPAQIVLNNNGLETAIERTNNTDSLERVRVIA